MIEDRSPLSWFQEWAMHMGWPAITLAAFMLGMYVKGIQHRLEVAEGKLTKLSETVQEIVERHLSAIHRTLAEIKGMIGGRR